MADPVDRCGGRLQDLPELQPCTAEAFATNKEHHDVQVARLANDGRPSCCLDSDCAWHVLFPLAHGNGSNSLRVSYINEVESSKIGAG